MKIIFKHSYRCSISLRAKEEMDNFLNEYPHKVDFESIDVINNRARSNEVAEQFGVRHESPQIIIIDDDNNVIWNASHSRITEENIRSAVGSREK
jgi:bacillithiol system protein YtxJ